MLTIKARIEIDDVLRSYADLGRQAPFATARALTWTGQAIKAAEASAIASSFDRPTAHTRNAVYLRPATKANLRALVWLKDGTRPEHYLLPHIEGGGRPMKRFEQRLRMLGYMRADERAVPGTAVQLDNYGNMSRGQITKVLSQLRTDVVSGVTQNASNSRRSRAKRARVEYFASGGPGTKRAGWAGRKPGVFDQHLPRGVWERSVHAWGTAVRPVLLFVKATNYKRRFPFFLVAQQIIDRRLVENVHRSALDALRSAGFQGAK